MTTKQDASKNYVAITDQGVADAKRYHRYIDCSTVRDRSESDFETVNEREIRLLNLKLCSVCERRETGGPAVIALAEVLDETNLFGDRDSFSDDAFKLIEALKGKGFYVAQRGVRSKAEENGKDAE